MHSGSTARRASRPDDAASNRANRLATARSLRPVSVLTVLGLAVLLLSGCASDRATDQGDARETAQTTPGVIVGDQATYSANRYASPTLTATATAPPPATVHEVGLATGVDGSGQPNGLYTAVPANAGTVYVVADLDGLRTGSVVATDWKTNQKKVSERQNFGGASFTVEHEGRQWAVLPMTLDGSLAPGKYGIFIFVDGQQVADLGIEVTAPGTQPKSA